MIISARFTALHYVGQEKGQGQMGRSSFWQVLFLALSVPFYSVTVWAGTAGTDNEKFANGQAWWSTGTFVPSGTAGARPDHNGTWWKGWHNGTSDDTSDALGLPDFPLALPGGYLDWTPDSSARTSGKIKSVRINTGGVTLNNAIEDVIWSGDLFLDLDDDDKWDFVVKAFDPKNSTTDVLKYAAAGSATTSDPNNRTNYELGAPGSGAYDLRWYDLDPSSTGGLDVKTAGQSANAVRASGAPWVDTSNVYVMSGEDNTDLWGHAIRDRHPIAVTWDHLKTVTPTTPYSYTNYSGKASWYWTTGEDRDSSLKTQGFPGQNSSANEWMHFDMDFAGDAGIPMDKFFAKVALKKSTDPDPAIRIGYTVNCANDVIDARITGLNVVGPIIPEPSSCLLFLTGVAGVGLARRRRAQSRSEEAV